MGNVRSCGVGLDVAVHHTGAADPDGACLRPPLFGKHHNPLVVRQTTVSGHALGKGTAAPQTGYENACGSVSRRSRISITRAAPCASSGRGREVRILGAWEGAGVRGRGAAAYCRRGKGALLGRLWGTAPSPGWLLEARWNAELVAGPRGKEQRGPAGGNVFTTCRDATTIHVTQALTPEIGRVRKKGAQRTQGLLDSMGASR